MRKIRKKRETFKAKFFKQCPSGGICMNPMCMFGCIDN